MDALSSDDPDRIGAYRLLGRLGEGGMGRVYLARSDRGRTVAVKVVQTELAAKPDFRRRFAQEVTAARRVGDTWTAPVLDADTEAATPWVATGYVAGPSLAEVVDGQYGPLPEKTVRALAAGLVRALEAIHGAGLVHRDLKPSNVLVTIDGPRVIDFGIARALDAAMQSADGLTRTGAVVGSPGFMSPEQARGLRVTPASDVFCLGAVLAYAATGRMPFGTADGNIHSLLFRISMEEPDLSGVPEGLYDLVAACLTKDAEQRPTVGSLLTALDGAEPGGAWLPGELLAQLGRHAVRLLDSEDPERHGFGPLFDPEQGPGSGPGSASGPGPGSGSGPQQTAASSPMGPGHGPGPGPGPGAGPGPGPVTAPGPGPHAYGYGPAPSTPPPAFGGAPHWQQQPPLTAAAGLTATAATSTPPPPFGHLPGARPDVVRAARGLAWGFSAVVALFLLMVLMETFVLFAADSRISEAQSAGLSSVETMTDFSTLKSASQVLENAAMLAAVPPVVLWLCWFRRVRNNAEVLAPGRIRYSRGMSVGTWFLPVCNFFMPKQISNDIWAASTGKPYTGFRRGAGLINAWWIFWLCSFLFFFVDKGSRWYAQTSLPSASDDVMFAQVTHVFVVAACVAAVLFAHRLSAIQATLRRPGAPF